MKEQTLWDFRQTNYASAEEAAEKLLSLSDVPQSTFSPNVAYHIENLSKEEIASIYLMSDYMLQTESAPKEVAMVVLAAQNSKKKQLRMCCEPMISALTKFPHKHEWKNNMPKKNVLALTNEEILENDVMYTLEELFDHGSSYVIQEISNAAATEQASKKQRKLP